MLKMRKKKENQRKTNNKGFSLVELIVVIAIMAVLVAVLAPQFMKYVDRSRQSVDAATVSGIVTAVQVGVADVTEYAIEPDTYTITIDKTKTEVAIAGSSPTAKAALEKAIVETCGQLDKLKVTANSWVGDKVVVTAVVAADGTVNISYTTDFAEYIGGDKTPSGSGGA